MTENDLSGIPRAESWRFMCMIAAIDAAAEKEKAAILKTLRQYAAHCRAAKE